MRYHTESACQASTISVFDVARDSCAKQMKAAQENGLEYAITEFTPGASKFKVRQLSTRQDKEMTVEELKTALQAIS